MVFTMAFKSQHSSLPQPEPYQRFPTHPSHAQVPTPKQPPPGAPKGDIRNTILLTIVLIVFVFAVAILVYLIYPRGHIGGCDTCEPQINLASGEPTGTIGEWKVEVAGATSGEAWSSYKVALVNNTSIAISAQSLDTLGSSCSGSPGIAFTDVAADGKLNAGDWFIVCGTDSVSDYQLQIFWNASGNKVSGNTGRIEQ